MKKLFSFLFTLFIVLQVSGHWSAGIRTGINFSKNTGKWNADDDSKNHMVLGAVAGAVANYSLNEMYSLTGELSYVTMGVKSEYTYEGGSRYANAMTVTERWRFNCLQTAIMARALFGLSCFSPFVYLGLCFTRKFGGVIVVDDGINNTRNNVVWEPYPIRATADDWYLDPQYNRRSDFRMCIGGGAAKELGPGRLELDLRFGIGLLDLNKFDNKDDKQNAKDNGYKAYRSMNKSLTLAYMYNFKKK